MSDSPDQPAASWLNPLAELLIRWNELHYDGWRKFQSILIRSLQQANCYQLMGWLVRAESCPKLTDDAEMAAPRAVLRALACVYDEPTETGSLTPNQRQELHDLRLRVTKAAQDRLDAPGPWVGEDWDGLPSLVRNLLLYMHRLERADLEKVFPAVWEREYVAGKSDVHLALHKANNFLLKRESRRTLHKRRGKGELYWE